MIKKAISHLYQRSVSVRVWIWDANNEGIRPESWTDASPFGTEAEVWSLVFSLTEKYFASGLQGGSIQMWRLQMRFVGSRFSPNSVRLACHSENAVMIWDVLDEPSSERYQNVGQRCRLRGVNLFLK